MTRSQLQDAFMGVGVTLSTIGVFMQFGTGAGLIYLGVVAMALAVLSPRGPDQPEAK